MQFHSPSHVSRISHQKQHIPCLKISKDSFQALLCERLTIKHDVRTCYLHVGYTPGGGHARETANLDAIG